MSILYKPTEDDEKDFFGELVVNVSNRAKLFNEKKKTKIFLFLGENQEENGIFRKFEKNIKCPYGSHNSNISAWEW